MTPILFVADCPQSTLIDPAAIGIDSNPFASRLQQWKELDLFSFIFDVDTGRWCGWQELNGSGPDGQSGLAIRVLPRDSREDAAPILSKETTWIRASDRVWFSQTDWTPSDLLRYSFEPIPTNPVKLSDNHVWDIPRIRRPIAGGYILPPLANASELPKRVRQTWDGEILVEPSPRWAELWATSTRFAQYLWGDGNPPTYSELFRYVLDVLQLRYRYTPLMSRAFPEILEEESLWKIVRATCGWDLVEAEIQQKKNLLDAAEAAP